MPFGPSWIPAPTSRSWGWFVDTHIDAALQQCERSSQAANASTDFPYHLLMTIPYLSIFRRLFIR